nr:DUF1295 domain-containing protein [Leucobacter chromiireducens]
MIGILIALLLGGVVAIAGSAGGAALGGVPLFALAVLAAYVVQLLAFIPAALLQSERFFDLTGALTYIGVSIALVLLAPAPDLRGLVLAAMVIIWAARLGSFLFLRVRRAGEDDRFAEIKQQPLVFLRVWVIQGLWVSVTASAAWIALSGDAAERAPMNWLAIVGVVVWLAGFAFEVIADLQKSAFKADPRNAGKFIRSGLWSTSRHPNYFGEILLWIGVFLVAAPVLSGWQWIALLSPILVAVLLTRVSGIPLLEAKAEKRWGGQPDYEAYTSETPVLIPRLPRRGNRP